MKIKGISREGISKPIQWMCVQRWPLILIVAPVVAGLTFWGVDSYIEPDKFSDKKDKTQARKDVLQITAQVFLGVAGLSGAYFTWQRLDVSREDQITDRYTRAIDQLGSEHLEIRLGGIYALERLAKDSSKDQETVMEVLTAFVRENASLQKSESTCLSENSDEEFDEPIDKEQEKTPEKITPNTDIQAILTVIGRRKWGVTGRIDLSGSNLHGANLYEANLYEANLSGSNLIEVDLSKANLIGANLIGANLYGADLREAFLSRAKLKGSNLRGAFLCSADLRGAVLKEADLRGAVLHETDLRGAFLSDLIDADLRGADLRGTFLLDADLRGADLRRANLRGIFLSNADLRGVKATTPDKIMKAKNWEQATYSDDIAAQLGLTSQPEETQEKSPEKPKSPN